MVQKKKSNILILLLFIISFLSVPEVAFRDFVLGLDAFEFIRLSTYILIIVNVLFALYYNALKISRPLLLIWLLYLAFISSSFIANNIIVWSLILQPSFIFILIIIFSSENFFDFKMYFYKIGIVIASLPLVSLMLHLLLPINGITRNAFVDHLGSSIGIVFLSFSPSFWNIGGTLIPRFSGIFDEPGTFGFFISIFASAVYWQKNTKTAIFIFLCGISSFSTAYLIFLIAILPVLIFNSIKNKYLIFISTIIILCTIFFIQFSNVFDFSVRRTLYAFSDHHNRVFGWYMAKNSIISNPLFGGLLHGYESTIIPASGIIVLMAYIGIPSILFLTFLIVGGVILKMKEMRYQFDDFRYCIPFIVAVVITILNRNNFFNYGGYIIALFAIVAGSAVTPDYVLSKTSPVSEN